MINLESTLPTQIVLAITLAVVWTAAWIDLRTFKIPNALSVLGVTAGLVIQTASAGIEGLGDSLAGFSMALALLFPLYLMGRAGAGDVKLMAAVGALLGPKQFLWALLLVIMAGGVLAIIYIGKAYHVRGATGPFKRYARMIRFIWVTGRLQYLPPPPTEAMAERIPLAVAIAFGTTAALLWPDWNLPG